MFGVGFVRPPVAIPGAAKKNHVLLPSKNVCAYTQNFRDDDDRGGGGGIFVIRWDAVTKGTR